MKSEEKKRQRMENDVKFKFISSISLSKQTPRKSLLGLLLIPTNFSCHLLLISPRRKEKRRMKMEGERRGRES
jgi:hypothetical protein